MCFSHVRGNDASPFASNAIARPHHISCNAASSAITRGSCSHVWAWCGQVAAFINAATDREVVFTRNATEAVNLVAQTWGIQNLRPGDEVSSAPASQISITVWNIYAIENQLSSQDSDCPFLCCHELYVKTSSGSAWLPGQVQFSSLHDRVPHLWQSRVAQRDSQQQLYKAAGLHCGEHHHQGSASQPGQINPMSSPPCLCWWQRYIRHFPTLAGVNTLWARGERNSHVVSGDRRCGALQPHLGRLGARKGRDRGPARRLAGPAVRRSCCRWRSTTPTWCLGRCWPTEPAPCSATPGSPSRRRSMWRRAPPRRPQRTPHCQTCACLPGSSISLPNGATDACIVFLHYP